MFELSLLVLLSSIQGALSRDHGSHEHSSTNSTGTSDDEGGTSVLTIIVGTHFSLSLISMCSLLI